MDDTRRVQLNQQRLADVNPALKSKVLVVIQKLEAAGLKPLITCGFRSFAQQNALYAQGRTKPGKIVTNARGGQSQHNFGKAVDFAFVDANGNINYDLKSYKLMDNIARPLGLICGGDWKSIKDYPHLEIK